MIVLVIILIIVIGLAVLALNAAILHTAVPALIQDPSNWWGWLGVLVVLSILFRASRSDRNK